MPFLENWIYIVNTLEIGYVIEVLLTLILKLESCCKVGGFGDDN
jgi:hypothetical protein